MNWSAISTDYKHYLNIERGFSKNTVENYSRDVKKLIAFLEDKELSISPIEIDKEMLLTFVYETSKKNKAKSQARLISGLRNFLTTLFLRNTGATTLPNT